MHHARYAPVVIGGHVNPPVLLSAVFLEGETGKVAYNRTESFMLQVFGETPSLDAAREMLGELRRCERATHRDTPCTPTYFFRINTHDSRDCATRAAQMLASCRPGEKGSAGSWRKR